MGMGQGQMGWCPCVRLQFLVNGLINLGLDQLETALHS
jgi:hypothetical protein